MKYIVRPVIKRTVAIFVFAFLLGTASLAQSAITLNVDASDASKNIIHVFETVSVRPGKFWLFYPKWIPGEHQPTGTLNNMINLHITAKGKTINWTRDDVEMFAFQCDIPPGVTSIDVSFDDAEQPGTVGSAYLTRIKWNRMLLYPRGVNQERITVTGSLKMPAGWQYATALPVKDQSGDTVNFSPVTLERFVDSPAIIGKNFKKVQLTGRGGLHEMDIAADTPEALVYKPETLTGWNNLVTQADRMFGAHHYNSYRFLLTLSDIGGSEGLEHHESSEDGTSLNALTETEAYYDLGDLLGHEYAHSWNGKYRRPAGLATPDFEQPMKGELLWVYEGLTEYLGEVLPARAGLWSPEIYRESLADFASFMDLQTGRNWRPVVDTARAVQFTYSAPRAWSNSRRGADYYYEGQMIWLEADIIIRQRTNGKKSLDDLLHTFHGGKDTSPVVVPYTFAGVLTALNSITPYDWAGFLNDRVYKIHPEGPLGGLEKSGWRLEYNDTPNVRVTGREARFNYASMIYSIGMSVGSDGLITDVRQGSAGAKAGLTPGMKIRGKDDKDFVLADFMKAVTGSKNTTGPIVLEIETGGEKTTVSVDYHGGIRHPHLVRIDGTPDILTETIKPR